MRWPLKRPARDYLETLRRLRNSTCHRLALDWPRYWRGKQIYCPMNGASGLISLLILSRIEKPVLIHYGSFETKFLSVIGGLNFT